MIFKCIPLINYDFFINLFLINVEKELFMTIYNINYGIGWASSGVEYAQLYRAKMLREQSERVKFIFLDFLHKKTFRL